MRPNPDRGWHIINIIAIAAFALCVLWLLRCALDMVLWTVEVERQTDLHEIEVEELRLPEFYRWDEEPECGQWSEEVE